MNNIKDFAKGFSGKMPGNKAKSTAVFADTAKKPNHDDSFHGSAGNTAKTPSNIMLKNKKGNSFRG